VNDVRRALPGSILFSAVLAFLLLGACAAARPAGETGPPAAPRLASAREDRLLRAAGIDPARIACNAENRWGRGLKQDAANGAGQLLELLAPSLRPLADAEQRALRRRLGDLLMWRMVRAVLIEGNNNNLGVIPLWGYRYRDAAGVERPVLVFRTGLTPAPDSLGSCFRTLLEEGRVKHVVNLFDGEIPAADLVAAEERTARQAGATYHSPSESREGTQGYGPWRETLRRHYAEPARRQEASSALARLVHEQILAPGGAPPVGNIHVHCGGGMHRTGMVIGLLERCINQEPLPTVEAHYRRHVGYRDAQNPGGYEEENVRFLREFDCSLFHAPR